MKTFQQPNLLHSSISYNLLQHSQIIQKFRLLLPKILPAPLNEYCQVANYRDKVLLVYVEQTLFDSPLWANKLRFEVLEPISLWQQENPTTLPPVEEVRKIKVIPIEPLSVYTLDDRPIPTISSKAGNYLQSTADSLSHLGLKNALLRLARHAVSGN